MEVNEGLVVTSVALALQMLTIISFTQKARAKNTSDGRINDDSASFPTSTEPDPNIDWDSLGFGLNGVSVDFMWHNVVSVDGDDSSTSCWESDPSTTSCLKPMGEISLHPAATVLNYGQSLFEGLKAFRRKDGKIVLFRPDRNAARNAAGAERLLMPPLPPDIFVKACSDLVLSNARWVPPHGQGALYLRPLLFGSGASLGVKPSHECTFCIYCSPVGEYFKKGGKARPIRLQAVQKYSRAAPGGVGSIKASGNYAPCFLVQREVRARGYDEALFVDCVRGEAIEEAGASNFFVVYPDNTIVTPPLGRILPGITRESIMQLASSELGYKVLEKPILLSDLADVAEAFCCGTGASVTPVGSVNIFDEANENELENTILFGDGESVGPLTEKLKSLLLDIQMGTAEAHIQDRYASWMHIVA